MKKYVLYLIVYFMSTVAFSQEYAFDWVNIWSDNDNSNMIAEWFSTDADNNLFVAGRTFGGLKDFDPTEAEYNIIITNTNAAYIAKFNTYGELQWATVLESDYTGNVGVTRPVEIQDIKATSSGEIYVTGYFLETLYYEGVSGEETKVSNGAQDIFFGKLNQQGEWEWIQTYGDIYDDQGESLTITDSGDIFVTGYFAEYVQFDPDTAPYYGEYYDLFILKFNSSDELQWVYSTAFTGVSSLITPRAIEVDSSGAIYITGHYWEIDDTPLDFDPGPGTTYLPTTGYYNTFLMKLDTSQNLLWVKSYASPNRDDGFDLVLDSSENILMSARMSAGTIDFDSSITGDEITAINTGAYYLLKLDTNGTFIWAKLFQPSGLSYDSSDTFALVLDNQDNIFLQGKFNNYIDIDPGPDEYTLNDIPGFSYDGFLIKLDANGNLISGQVLGTSSTDVTRGLAVDTFGNVYGGLRSGDLSSGYSINFGDLNYTVSGGSGVNYFYKITNCGEELVHQLEDGSLYADANNATYQWLDCDNGNVPIPGETNRTFIPSTTGNYALQATNYNCVDISPCFSFSTLSTNENNFNDKGLTLYPNPTEDLLAINLDTSIEEIQVSLFSITGKNLGSYLCHNGSKINISHLSSGMYLLKAKMNSIEKTIKFVKE